MTLAGCAAAIVALRKKILTTGLADLIDAVIWRFWRSAEASSV
jgi:hypothetical protein